MPRKDKKAQDNGPSVAQSIRDQLDHLQENPPQKKKPPRRPSRLGWLMGYSWRWSLGIGCFALVFALLLVGIATGFNMCERNDRQNERNARIMDTIKAYAGNYIRSEKSVMGAPSRYPAEKEQVVNWFLRHLAALNRTRGSAVSVHSTLQEKAAAAHAIVETNLRLTDGADWDNGANDRFSTSREVIKRGGGDDIDLAQMKVAFLRIMQVPDDKAYTVLYANNPKEGLKGVAVVKLPDGTERYLDNAAGSRQPDRSTYQEFVEYNLSHYKDR